MTGRDEFDLIATHFAPLATAPGALGLRDDAALLDPEPGTQLVITTDAVVAGVHFLEADPPDDVARKALRVNLSDLAAMGAAPVGYTLATALPARVEDAWLTAFAAALAEDQATFGGTLLGGDTVVTPGPLTVTVTAFGRLAAGQALRRDAAAAGDDLWVSGTLGDAALGLRAALGGLAGLPEADRAYLLDRYRRPRPRLALGRRLVGLAGGALDVSDGLLADLGHVCAASGLGARVDSAALPLSTATRRALDGDPSLVAAPLGGGDDYELLFTAPPAARDRVREAAEAAGVAATRIGAMEVASGVRVVDSRGRLVDIGDRGWNHFRDAGQGADGK